MKASVFVATSLDGFIARSDGDIDWLHSTQPDTNPDGVEDHGYSEFMESVDTIVMGRNTFEKVLSFDIPWPYKKPVVVLTSRPHTISTDQNSQITAMSGSPEEIVSQLEHRSASHLYIDGGKTVQQFLNAGLIQRLIITTIPILLGDGIRLFGPLAADIRLAHARTQPFPGGLVQTEYELLRA